MSLPSYDVKLDEFVIFSERPRKKGLGAVAVKCLEAGTVICVDKPLLLVRGDEIGLKDVCEHGNSIRTNRIFHALAPAVLLRQYGELSGEDQSKVEELFDCYADNSDPKVRQMLLLIKQKGLGLSEQDVQNKFSTTAQTAALSKSKALSAGNHKSVFGIFLTNCIPEGDENAFGLYPLISRFNHSCIPNAIYQWRASLGANVVVTTRDITEGEEISVSYFKSLYMTRGERQKRTVFSWGFQCQCGACEPIPDELRSEMEEVRQKIRVACEQDPSLDDSDLPNIVSKRHLDLLKLGADSDDHRERLWQLNQAMERATGLQQGLRMHAEMKDLFEKEALIPGLKVESLLNFDLLNLYAVYGKGSGKELDAARLLTQEHCRLTETLNPEDTELEKFHRWRDSTYGAPTQMDLMPGMPSMAGLSLEGMLADRDNRECPTQ
eukprot:TRINITY_DN20948_c0_g1_i1.p1 TRINITY_DN20948_c0_g1~~TRINITY_DN20948_c0_g1_i1.p1  ORF type:complete len:436 (+),score=50.30 TRINITY_DN20948_c0_g1_i1:49-1356(+)